MLSALNEFYGEPGFLSVPCEPWELCGFAALQEPFLG